MYNYLDHIKTNKKNRLKKGDLVRRNIHNELWVVLDTDTDEGDVAIWLNTTGSVHYLLKSLVATIISEQLTILSRMK